jgi:dihydroorotase
MEKIAEKTSHSVAECFQLKERGYLREGYFADLVIIDSNKPVRVNQENVLYKCGWSPLETVMFPCSVTHTFVNGNLVYENGKWDESRRGERLKFDR